MGKDSPLNLITIQQDLLIYQFTFAAQGECPLKFIMISHQRGDRSYLAMATSLFTTLEAGDLQFCGTHNEARMFSLARQFHSPFTYHKELTMKKMTTKTKLVPQIAYILILPTILFSAGISSAVAQQIDVLPGKESACDVGYAETWVIGSACDLGGRTDIKSDDAIHIQCDTKTGRWSVDFYEEQANSQSVRYEICPGNGFLTKSKSGKPMLQCNFWEPNDNVAKQLEFELEPVINSSIKSMSWRSYERDNPNVVCGVAGRPSDPDTGGSSHTIVSF